METFWQNLSLTEQRDKFCEYSCVIINNQQYFMIKLIIGIQYFINYIKQMQLDIDCAIFEFLP